ncbi:MAG: sigma-54-dependent Fis family transcriptional regulator, partial [Spirochaetia bacterium]|nr:sigma-54-dependent Fis family transcriptional regulator [Spirochaetia bacterium]
PVSIVFVSDGELREVVIDRKSPIPLRREDKILLTRLFSRKSLPEDAILKPIDAFIKDSASHALVRRGLAEYLHFMDRQGFPVVTPLRRGKSWCGFILLGSRTDGSSLSSSQKLYLENISHFAGLVFSAQSPAQSVREWKPKVEAGDDVRRISVGDRVLVFRSERMHEWYDTLGSLSAVSFPVLITGETGTGKEMAARLMHELGPRKTEPFVAINCAAIPENLWEDEIFGHVRGAYTDAKGDRSGRVHQAAGGILFFDEIGEMPPEIQPKMLRLLQDRTYTPLGSTQSERAECRFIFATNRQLGDTDSKRSFRSDLLYRINVLRLQLPPLRERKTDIPLLLSHYMEKYSREFGVPEKHLEEGAILRLVSYEWPGNVRELENIIVGLLAGSRHPAITAREVDRILSGHATSEKPVFPLRLEEHLDKIAGRLVEKALAESDGNKSKAARLLGLTRGQLLYRMREALRD